MGAQHRMIEGVCFDLGGVIVNSPFDALTALERRSGVAAGAVRAINSRNPHSNAWALIERGDIDRHEFVRLFEVEAAALGYQLSGREVIDIAWHSTAERSTAHPAMLDALARCHAAGVGLAIITNNMRPMSNDSSAAWLYDEFDVVLESCVSGMRKPDSEIYHSALHKLGVQPSRSVMLDDLGINLKPARALGMHTIKVIDPAVAAGELAALLMNYATDGRVLPLGTAPACG